MRNGLHLQAYLLLLVVTVLSIMFTALTFNAPIDPLPHWRVPPISTETRMPTAAAGWWATPLPTSVFKEQPR
jgi:hypothetical protein